MARRAVFLDRDGTLNRQFSGRPPNGPEEVALLPGVADGLRKFKEAGFLLVVVTNQSGVGLGYLTLDDLKAINERLNDLLIKEKSPTIDAFYWCIHKPSDRCSCRKPNPGMLTKAADDLGIDLESSYMVGDNVRDMDAAARAGVRKKYMVVSEHYQDTPLADGVFHDLDGAASHILRREGVPV